MEERFQNKEVLVAYAMDITRTAFQGLNKRMNGGRRRPFSKGWKDMPKVTPVSKHSLVTKASGSLSKTGWGWMALTILFFSGRSDLSCLAWGCVFHCDSTVRRSGRMLKEFPSSSTAQIILLYNLSLTLIKSFWV